MYYFVNVYVDYRNCFHEIGHISGKEDVRYRLAPSSLFLQCRGVITGLSSSFTNSNGNWHSGIILCQLHVKYATGP